MCCRVAVQTPGCCPPWVPLVVEESDVAEDLEFLHHVALRRAPRVLVLQPLSVDESTRSFGFWNSGVLKSGDGVSTGDALASSPERVDVALLSNELVMSAKNTFFIEDCGGPGGGSFFFIALDKFKVGVWEGSDEFLIGVAGVLVTSGDALRIRLGESSGIAACPGFTAISAEVPGIDDICVAFSDKVVRDAGFRCAWPLFGCLLYTSPSPRDRQKSRMPSSA